MRPTFTTFRLSQLTILTRSEKTDGKWIEYDKKKKAHGWFQTVTEFPDVLIRPSECVLCAAGVTHTP